MKVGFLSLLAVLAVQMAAAGETICFEAESAVRIEPPMSLVHAGEARLSGTNRAVQGASGGRYVEIAQGQGNPPKVKGGEAVYEFTVTAGGTFILWCRVWWADECGNSFSMSVNGERPFSFGQDGTFGCWHWVKSPPRLKQLELLPGHHTLKVMNREDGVRIDQLLLTNDSRFVPVGIEPVTPVPAPSAPGSGAGTSAAGKP